MSDLISKEEAIHSVTKVELKDGTFAEAKIEIGKVQPISVTEIVRKTVERIIERLEEEKHSTLPTFDEDGYCNDDSWEVVDFDTAIDIVKKEGAE